MSKMFPFITHTWNPLAGECEHDCVGCWAKELAKRYGWKKYQGPPRIDEKQINRRFKAGAFVFVQDMSDLLAENVPREMILRVFEAIKRSPDAKFLLLTKNPFKYVELIDEIPRNCVVGATIETNRNEPRHSKAPFPLDRYLSIAMYNILANKPQQPRSREIFISVEPIKDFDLDNLLTVIVKSGASSVAIGYDNYGNGFKEPKLEKTLQLIRILENKYRVKVYRKTLREAAASE